MTSSFPRIGSCLRLPGVVLLAADNADLAAAWSASLRDLTESRARLTEASDRDGIHFAIADDGVGMDTSADSDGQGLTGMKDRIGAVGGELEVVSESGRGTTVRGTVPESAADRTSLRPVAPL